MTYERKSPYLSRDTLVQRVSPDGEVCRVLLATDVEDHVGVGGLHAGGALLEVEADGVALHEEVLEERMGNSTVLAMSQH